MGIRLPHHVAAALGVILTARVSRHEPSRHPDSTTHDRQRAGEQVAVAAPGSEEEVLHGILAEGHRGGIERVGAVLLEVGDEPGQSIGRRGSIASHAPSEVGCASRAQWDPHV